MRIESSVVSMVSQHTLLEQELEQETLRQWGGGQAAAGNAGGLMGPAQQVEISEQAKELYKQTTDAVARTAKEELGLELSEEDKRKIELIQDLYELLTRKKLKFVLPRIKIDPSALRPINVEPQRLGWGLDYQYYYRRVEQEQMSFAAAGTVKTADGKEIQFAVSLGMSRQFMEEQHISVKAGDALIDPLVINFDAPAAKLTDTKFAFDIDSDGDNEQVSFVSQGSGFLAVDLNEDGIINDGQELFGPNTGNGFAELTEYDSDGNNWIDENDEIYEKLRIWTKDANGGDQLFAIGQKGIGAIYLGNVGTEFAHKSLIDNTLQGKLRSTGVFLRENGTAGLVQQIDLAV